MIPSLIFLLLRRYRKQYPEKAQKLLYKLRFVARIAVLLLLTICMALYAYTQERVLHYTITRSGSPIGTLVLKENKEGVRTTYGLQSHVKTSFLVPVVVTTMQEAIYENSVLTYLRFYQKVNNNERVNTQIRAAGNGYAVVNSKESKAVSSYPITYNMICLYTVEPLSVKMMFADKFKQAIPIETLGPHHYKITFPDGAYNEYYYQSGICTKVKLYTTWFNAEMVLKK